MVSELSLKAKILNEEQVLNYKSSSIVQKKALFVINKADIIEDEEEVEEIVKEDIATFWGNGEHCFYSSEQVLKYLCGMEDMLLPSLEQHMEDFFEKYYCGLIKDYYRNQLTPILNDINYYIEKIQFLTNRTQIQLEEFSEERNMILTSLMDSFCKNGKKNNSELKERRQILLTSFQTILQKNEKNIVAIIEDGGDAAMEAIIKAKATALLYDNISKDNFRNTVKNATIQCIHQFFKWIQIRYQGSDNVFKQLENCFHETYYDVLNVCDEVGGVLSFGKKVNSSPITKRAVIAGIFLGSLSMAAFSIGAIAMAPVILSATAAAGAVGVAVAASAALASSVSIAIDISWIKWECSDDEFKKNYLEKVLSSGIGIARKVMTDGNYAKILASNRFEYIENLVSNTYDKILNITPLAEQEGLEKITSLSWMNNLVKLLTYSGINEEELEIYYDKPICGRSKNLIFLNILFVD